MNKFVTEMAIPVDVGPPALTKIMTPTNVYMQSMPDGSDCFDTPLTG